MRMRKRNGTKQRRSAGSNGSEKSWERSTCFSFFGEKCTTCEKWETENYEMEKVLCVYLYIYIYIYIICMYTHGTGGTSEC